MIGRIRGFAMQIMSLQTRMLKRSVALIIGLTLTLVAEAGANHDWHVIVGKHPTLKLNGKRIILTRALKAQMLGADEATFLPVDIESGPKKHARLLALRSSSRANGSAGFCGAGHEDRILLIEVNGLTAKRADEFLAQSCLRSISMDVDQLDDLAKAFDIDPQDGALTFQQSLSSESSVYRQLVRLKVVREKMIVVTQRIQE